MRRGERRAMARLGTVVAVVAASLSGVAGPPPPAGAATHGARAHVLALDAARAIAVDPGTGKVFVAGDDTVVVRSATGAALGRIGAMDGASEVVAAAGSVFVLLRGMASIARIDPVTLQRTGLWSVGPAEDVWGLAYAADRLWTSVEHPVVDHDTGIVSIDPSTGARAVGPSEYWWQTMELVSSPLFPDRLIGGEIQNSGGTIRVFEIGGAAVEVVAATATDVYIEDLAVSGDGTKVLSSSYLGVEELTLPTLAPSGASYPLDDGSTAVDATATALSGGLVVTASRMPYAAFDLEVFRGGSSVAVASADTYSDQLSVMAGGVALAPGGARAYAVRSDWYPHDEPTSAELLVIDLGPTVSTVTPRVVGTRGGGRVTVHGASLGRTTVTVGGKGTSGATGTATARTVTVPVLTTGSAPVAVSNLFGATTTSSTPVIVRDLGPFRDSAGFADRQHRDFAGRAATASETGAADAALAAGTSVGVLPVQLARSASFAERRGQVIRLYQAVYLRPPDTGGMDYWLAQLAAGRSLTWVASSFAAAPEFTARYGSLTNAQFVDRIYQNVLGRPGEAAGRAYWTGELDKGKPRGTVVLGFSQSAEYRGQTANQVDVTNLYLGMLRRAPSASELSTALSAVTSTSIQAVAAGIVVSTEYRTRIG